MLGGGNCLKEGWVEYVGWLEGGGGGGIVRGPEGWVESNGGESWGDREGGREEGLEIAGERFR